MGKEGLLGLPQSGALPELPPQVIEVRALDLAVVVAQLVAIDIEVLPDDAGPCG